MRTALVVFHDFGNHWADRWLQPGFKHVFVCVQAEATSQLSKWVRVDSMDGRVKVDIVCHTEYDLASFYRREGLTVLKVRRCDFPFRLPLAVANCVGMSKFLLGITAPMVWTPYQLFRYLTTRRGFSLPGKSVFDPPKPKAIEQPKPAPVRTDPVIEEAADDVRSQELRRRGRRAAVMTSASGLEEELGVIARPEARAAALLGRTGSA